MKKMVTRFALLALCTMAAGSLDAQKKKKTDILQSTSIQEIEAFLQTAHPEDPRRYVLKPKLITLKNEEWTKGARNHKPMEPRPLAADTPVAAIGPKLPSEDQEFTALLKADMETRKQNTVKLLNTLFDPDRMSNEAVLVVQNQSDCNMILRLQGSGAQYSLAVPTKGENILVLTAGSYQLLSNVCDVKYTSTKNLKGNMMVIVGNPVMQKYASGGPSSGSVSN